MLGVDYSYPVLCFVFLVCKEEMIFQIQQNFIQKRIKFICKNFPLLQLSEILMYSGSAAG